MWSCSGLRSALSRCVSLSTVRTVPEGKNHCLFRMHSLLLPNTVTRWCAGFHLSARHFDEANLKSSPKFMPDFEQVKILKE